MLMVMPRWRSSGALSIWSNAEAWFRVGYLSARTFVIAAVRVVLPWSTWPMVPMLTCGLLRSNFAFATAGPPQDLMMRRATSVLSSGRQGVGGWIWTGIAVEPGPVPVGLAPRRPRLWRVRTATHSGQSVPLSYFLARNRLLVPTRHWPSLCAMTNARNSPDCSTAAMALSAGVGTGSCCPVLHSRRTATCCMITRCSALRIGLLALGGNSGLRWHRISQSECDALLAVLLRGFDCSH